MTIDSTLVSSVPEPDRGIRWVFEKWRCVMADEKEIRRKVLLRSLGSPVVLAPFLAGLTAMAATLALGTRIAFGVFAGIVGTLAAAGTFFTRMILSGESMAREVIAEIEAEEQAQRQEALDALDDTLSTADEDPRPEAALRDLRALVKEINALGDQAEGTLVHSIAPIRQSVSQLFEQSVYSLSQTDRLWRTARRLHTKSARRPILEQREKIIADVQATVKQLSDTLANLQVFNSKANPSTELQRLRTELDQSLEVARNVEARVQSLLDGAALPSKDRALPSN